MNDPSKWDLDDDELLNPSHHKADDLRWHYAQELTQKSLEGFRELKDCLASPAFEDNLHCPKTLFQRELLEKVAEEGGQLPTGATDVKEFVNEQWDGLTEEERLGYMVRSEAHPELL